MLDILAAGSVFGLILLWLFAAEMHYRQDLERRDKGWSDFIHGKSRSK